jgi:hypothetical protein
MSRERVDNLLAAGECLGVTHVTNGFLPAPPGRVERRGGGGRPRGLLPAAGVRPRETRGQEGLLGDFQSLLRDGGSSWNGPGLGRSRLSRAQGCPVGEVGHSGSR